MASKKGTNKKSGKVTDKSNEISEGKNKINPKSEEEDSSVGGRKGNREIYWMLGAGILLVSIFFGAYYFFGSLNSIEYEGLAFTKEKFGEIPVYHHYYYFNSDDQLYKYNLYLRNDPRRNRVPVTGNAVDDGIEFGRHNPIYLSIDPDESIVGCEYAAVGISSLSSFLADNQLIIKSASTNLEQAELLGIEHITCDNIYSADVGIIIKSGEETLVIQEKGNCHVIEVNNCEVLEAVEKFEVKAILDARAKRLAASA
jgi:hypothetical protein